MKPYLKPSPAKLVIALILFVAIVVVHSCKKDRAGQARTVTPDNPVITQAQRWYDSVYTKQLSKTGKQTTQSVGQSVHDWSQKFKPYWAKANVFMQSGMTFIELPAIKSGDMAVSFSKLKDSTHIDFGRSGTMTNLLIVKQGANFGMYAMTILADSSYLQGDYTKVANNSYAKMDSTFTGAVFFHRMDGSFVNGWRYQNGQVTRQLSSAPDGGTMVQNNSRLQVNVTTSPCSTIKVTTYWLNCSYSESTNYTVPYDCYVSTTVDYYQECSGTVTETGNTGGSPPPPCQVPSSGSSTPPPGSGSGQVPNGVGGKLNVDVTTPPTGSGGTTPTDPQPLPAPLQPCASSNPTQTAPATPKITNSVKNPCLYNQVQSAVSNNILFDIDKSMVSIFGSNTDFNLNFNDNQSYLTNQSDDAETTPQSINKTTQQGTNRIIISSMNLDITLNPTILAGSSKEFIAATIIHEAFHAYLRSSQTILNQHVDMARNYLAVMEQDLISMFPNMSQADAQALTWAGLETDAGSLYSSLSDMQKSIMQSTNDNYKKGLSGQKCQ